MGHMVLVRPRAPPCFPTLWGATALQGEPGLVHGGEAGVPSLTNRSKVRHNIPELLELLCRGAQFALQGVRLNPRVAPGDHSGTRCALEASWRSPLQLRLQRPLRQDGFGASTTQRHHLHRCQSLQRKPGKLLTSAIPRLTQGQQSFELEAPFGAGVRAHARKHEACFNLDAVSSDSNAN